MLNAGRCLRTFAGLTKPGQRGVRIDVEIPEPLVKKLRLRALEARDGKKGGLRDVVIEALEQYLEARDSLARQITN